MNVDRMALISADHRATRAFLSEAADVGIRVEDIYEYKSFPTTYSKGKLDLESGLTFWFKLLQIYYFGTYNTYLSIPFNIF